MLPEMSHNENLPVEIGEVVQIILSKWPEEEKEAFSQLDFFALDSLKLTLGLDIRNMFQLWSGNPKLLEACQLEIDRQPLLKEILWKVFYVTAWEEGFDEAEKQAAQSKEEEKTAFREVFSEMNAYLASELIIIMTWIAVQKNQMNLVQLSQLSLKE